MKTTSFHLSGRPRNPKRPASAFTLVEAIIAMSIMILVLAGVLAAQAFGMKMFQFTNAKLGASDDARKALDYLATELRSAKIVQLGNGGAGATNFVVCAPGQLQVGSAIQLYQTTNTSTFVRYFWNAKTTQLERSPNGTNSMVVVANLITNSTVFACEDAFGNVLTNNQNNFVVSLKLQFYQIQYPIMNIGPGNYYDYYQLSTKMAPRAFE